MVVIFSHIAAFCALFIGAIFDLKTTEVPDSLNVVGVLAGIGLHAYTTLSYFQPSNLGSLGLLISSPWEWFMALGDPLAWCLGIGFLFSLYGWSLYFLGMWGGADAFAMSVLGFGAPYAVSGPSITYPASLFTAVLIAGFVYTLIFAFWKALNNRKIFAKTWKDLKQNERRISLEIVAVTFISAFTALNSSRLGIFYFVTFLALIFLYRFFQNIENNLMVEEVAVENLEGGEVLAKDEDQGGKVEGITQEQIQSLDKDYVKVRGGIKFVPVFPIALFLVDVIGFRISWLFMLLS